MSSSNPIDLADHDLAALQEARDLLGRARQAAATLAQWTPEEAKRVAKEVAAALLPRAEFYAEWAVRESRIGKVADKIAKNQLACTLTPTAWDNVALGGVRTGLFSADDALAAKLSSAGEQAQDLCWRMPLDDEYGEGLKSNFADMGNVAGRSGGAISAAKFLQKFTGDLCWAHLDIAGTAWKSGAAKGSTGRPVPLLLQYVLNEAAIGQAAAPVADKAEKSAKAKKSQG